MSEYPEYAELQGLRAEDNRRRAGELAKTRKKIALKRELHSLAFGMHIADAQARRLRSLAGALVAEPGCTRRSPRWYRRRTTRTAAGYDAIARLYRRALVETNRAYHPPVIKKGLTR